MSTFHFELVDKVIPATKMVLSTVLMVCGFWFGTL